MVSADRLNPLDELRLLDRQIDNISEFGDLKPIFSRADELARLHSGDFEVQIAVNEIKQRLLDRGKLFKHAEQTPPPTRIPQTSSPPSGLETSSGIRPAPPGAGWPVSSVPPRPITQVPLADLGSGIEPRPVISLPASPSSAETVAPGAAAFSPGIAPTGGEGRNASPGKVPPPPRAPARERKPHGRWIAALAIALILAVVVGALARRARQRRLTAGVAIQVATNPPGASVRVNGEPLCTSNCSFSVPPGNYQVTAFLDGYEAAASNLIVQAGKPTTVNLALDPQPQTVRVLTDLDQGKAAVDDQPPVDLQDGQFVLEKIAIGKHTIKVTSRTGEATFSVIVADGIQPVIDGPVAAKNLMVVLVASLGSKAHVVTNGGPWTFSLNGQAQADASPAGIDLNNFQNGVDEIVVSEGKTQHNMKESFGPGPMLTAFLKSDLNIGTLIISTGEDNVRVFVNNKEYTRKTQHGQVRIPAIGPVNVRVAKDGFETLAAQTAEVAKGSEVRLEFKMQGLPQSAVLQIRGGTPGTEVVLDDKSIGTVGDDGSFTASNVKPGDHTVELRRERYQAKRIVRTFRAGQTMALAGADTVLASALGIVKVARTPAEAAVFFRRADEQQNHELKDNQLDLPPGGYVFTARAPGFTERSERVQLSAGETHQVELTLAKIVAPPPPPPAPKISGIADFEDPGAWSSQNGLWTHRGGGFIPFKPAANGTFTFTAQLLHGGNVFREGRIRWALQYVDAKNYDLFELDKKYLYSKVIINGKTFERDKHEHGLSDKDKGYTIQIESAPERLVHRLQNGDNWLVLDTWTEPGRDFTQGKFGFLVQGSDQLGLSDFKFVPNK